MNIFDGKSVTWSGSMKYLKIFSFLAYFIIILLSFILYDHINNILPIFRGITIEKNLFWATRIQFTNLLTFCAILILGNYLLRYEDFNKSKVVVFSLIITVVCKGVIEFVALFSTELLAKSVFILIPILLIGLLIASHYSNYIFKSKRWKNIRFTTIEKILLSVIGIFYIVINMHSLMYIIQNI